MFQLFFKNDRNFFFINSSIHNFATQRHAIWLNAFIHILKENLYCECFKFMEIKASTVWHFAKREKKESDAHQIVHKSTNVVGTVSESSSHGENDQMSLLNTSYTIYKENDSHSV